MFRIERALKRLGLTLALASACSALMLSGTVALMTSSSPALAATPAMTA